MPRDASGLTLMAVHAHPDDEASSTGGVLARYAEEGVRTVLVTCTNGELGDAPGGVKPGEPGHDEAALVEIRRAELAKSCELLGIGALERLGYRDSGMMGWPQNDDPRAFWSTPVEAAAGRLAELVDRHRPDVVVTYDEKGFYGHPDHIQAHRITMAAVEAAGSVAKCYFATAPRSTFAELLPHLDDEDAPDESVDISSVGTPDELITTYVDCRAYVPRKRAALAAHASQLEATGFLRMPEDVFTRFFGTEAFVRHLDRTGAPLPEDDLFAGLR